MSASSGYANPLLLTDFEILVLLRGLARRHAEAAAIRESVLEDYRARDLARLIWGSNLRTTTETSLATTLVEAMRDNDYYAGPRHVKDVPINDRQKLEEWLDE